LGGAIFFCTMANNSDLYVFGSLTRLQVEFADEVNLAGGEDHDENLQQGWDMNWVCTVYLFGVGLV